jgi:CheY-like chemotaxis protein
MPRITLVEDNPEICRATVEALRQADYEVETCPEPRAVFACVCQAPPDLVILSVPPDQPRFGYEALDHLKQQEETNAIPVLLAVPTPETFASDRQALAERGVHVLPQPIRSADLIQRVEDVLGPPVAR